MDREQLLAGFVNQYRFYCGTLQYFDGKFLKIRLANGKSIRIPKEDMGSVHEVEEKRHSIGVEEFKRIDHDRLIERRGIYQLNKDPNLIGFFWRKYKHRLILTSYVNGMQGINFQRFWNQITSIDQLFMKGEKSVFKADIFHAGKDYSFERGELMVVRLKTPKHLDKQFIIGFFDKMTKANLQMRTISRGRDFKGNSIRMEHRFIDSVVAIEWKDLKKFCKGQVRISWT